MGADIHGVIEYKIKGEEREDGTAYAWKTVGDIGMRRNYTMFGLIAGVRDESVKPIVKPRGMPKDDSYNVTDGYYLFVCDDEATLAEHPYAYITRADAEKSVARKSAHWHPTNSHYVSHPDWHTPTWLTSGEAKQVAMAFRKLRGKPKGWYDPEMDAQWSGYCALMKEMERVSPSITCRITLWFDN